MARLRRVRESRRSRHPGVTTAPDVVAPSEQVRRKTYGDGRNRRSTASETEHRPLWSRRGEHRGVALCTAPDNELVLSERTERE